MNFGSLPNEETFCFKIVSENAETSIQTKRESESRMSEVAKVNKYDCMDLVCVNCVISI